MLKYIKNGKIIMSYRQEMINLKIEMIGYNDTKAIAIYGTIKMIPFFIR